MKNILLSLTIASLVVTSLEAGMGHHQYRKQGCLSTNQKGQNKCGGYQHRKQGYCLSTNQKGQNKCGGYHHKRLYENI